MKNKSNRNTPKFYKRYKEIRHKAQVAFSLRNKRLSVRLDPELKKEFDKLLIDMGKSFQTWAKEKVMEELSKGEFLK